MPSVRSILSTLGIAPNRKLGQNFLVHPEVAEKIAAWSDVPEGATVIEIGPGLGALTQVLLARHSVLAIEKDKKLFTHLASAWKDRSGFTVVHEDALNFDYAALPRDRAPYFVCSNLPYSVSTPVIEALLAHRSLFSGITLLLQKELVDRLLAVPGTPAFGSLTVFVQSQCDVVGGPLISRGSFHPAPDVDSKLVRLVPRAELRAKVPDESGFFSFVQSMFQFRRKSIRKALEHVTRRKGKDFDGIVGEEILGDRIEERSIEEIAALYATLRNLP